jgi:tetratricopeptide (TPR) repeat protein
MVDRASPGVAAAGASPALAALSAEQLRLLAYASAIGSEFDFELLVAAMGVPEEDLAEQIERLVHDGVLRVRAGGGRFGFEEEEFRARVYRSLTESRLRVLHRKIADVMEAMHPHPSPEELAELGRHYFLAKVPEKSFKYNREAAEVARAADEPEVAVHHLERVLVDLAAIGGDRRKDEAEVAESLGDLYFALGNFRASDRYYTDALSKADTGDPRIHGRLLLARAEVARENLDVEPTINGAAQALRLFAAADDRIGIAQTYRLLGRVAFQRGSYREALDQSMRALDALPTRGDPRFLGRLSIDIGNSFALLGPEVRTEAIEWYERAVDRLRQSGDWPELSRAYHNLGVTVGELRPHEGLEFLEQARDAAERAHDARATGRALLSGVELRISLGELEEAHRDNEQAGRLLERLGDMLSVEQVAANRGIIAEKRGQWEDAERAFQEALSLARRFQLTADEAEVHFYLARLRNKTRNLDGARAAFRAATDLKVAELRPQLAQPYEELKRQLFPEAAGAAPATGPAGEHPL